MKVRFILAPLLFLLIQGCGTIPFNPPVHELAVESIPGFSVSGPVTINNAQENAEPVIIHSYGGTKYQSNYNEITETMVSQAKFELERHGTMSGGNQEKTIGLKVTHLISKYIAFYWKGAMTFTVTLGNGEEFELSIEHGTGSGAAQDLSGSIADGVVALYKDERVKAYLAN